MNDSSVLNREEALGHYYVKYDGQDQCGDGYKQSESLESENPLECPPIEGDHSFEYSLGNRIEPAALVFGLRLQQLRAHHRGQCQRNDRRDQNRDAERDRKFSEQPADYIAHEQQRDQHGYQ